MKELIEKQAVIDALLSKMDTIDDKPEVVLGMAVAAGMIKDMPSALDQEPCTDAISRQAVIEAIEDDNRNGHYSCFASNNDAQCFKQIIRDLPSVTPAEKVGRWNPYDGSWYECSECGAIREAVGYFENFCPNCGSKMSEIPTSCSTCILDNTDACTRGSGRAVDDEACEDYLASPTGAEGSEKE